ncbi:hypothetical protein EAE96_004505 [Botrytis aclada]|nr:hypothetical protein EAE96_004505 [Botrytis aclada]
MVALFNDDHLGLSKQNQTSRFHLFSEFPKEIRLNIWTLSLEQHRFIPICVGKTARQDNANHYDQSQFYSSHNDLGKIISGGHYELFINKPILDTTSQLFYTTKESRSTALDFYRIRLPLARGHIRINPECDLLFLQDWDKAPQVLANILHDIKAYDPKDEGLMHLALAEGSGDSLFDIPHPSKYTLRAY